MLKRTYFMTVIDSKFVHIYVELLVQHISVVKWVVITLQTL